MQKKSHKKQLKYLFIFLLSFFVILLVTGFYINNRSKLDSVTMEHLALTKANKVTNVLSTLLYKTQSLSALVIQTSGEISDFERVAATIVDDPAIRNVIIAPDGIVTHVYPLEGNETLLGFSYFDENAGNKEAILARDSEKLVLGGPFNLMQGGQALVGRLPVYLEDAEHIKQFWGIVSVTLNYPEALEGAELSQLKDQGYAYEIWRIDPDTDERQVIASSNYNYNKNSNYVEQPFTTLNTTWYFRLSPIRDWYEYPETWIFLSVGFIICLLVTFLIIHNDHLKELQKELKSISTVDYLTNILNRRGLFLSLEELLQNPAGKFVLCYIDINKFKQVNDTYGHNAGDTLLLYFTQTLQQHLDENHIFARIGGDEFILIFKNTTDINMANAFFAHIKEQFQKPFILSNTIKIPFHFSVGFSCYPEDSKNLDELLAIADNKMYQQKNL